MSLRIPPPRPRAQMDVSLAIVNLVLLLIFFFLISGRMDAPTGHGVDVAHSQDLPLDQLPSPVLVVPDQGEWQLDGMAVSPELLAVALDAWPGDLPVHLVIDRGAPAERLAALLARPELARRMVRLVTVRSGAP